MNNIRGFLDFNDSYNIINREERNLAAIFYHLLLINNNLSSFLKTINYKFPVVEDEMGVYFEYAFLRDLWNKKTHFDNELKRNLIYKFLDPINIKELKSMTTFEFNSYFGSVPKPSGKHIQSPGKWSILRYKDTIYDNDEFLKVSKFKWAFNAKPDIVIHTSHETAICIECKNEYGEGIYPREQNEKKEFRARSLDFVSQTSIQEYMMEKLLGINTEFIYLVQKERAVSQTHKTFLWKDVFSELELEGCPIFIIEVIRGIKTL